MFIHCTNLWSVVNLQVHLSLAHQEAWLWWKMKTC